MMKRKAFWALLAAGMTVVSTGLVSAQSDSLAGIWEEIVTFPNDPTRVPPTVRALIVYHQDGTLVATEGGSVVLDPPAKNPHTPQTGMVTSNDMGLWKQTGPRTFEYTSYVLFSDLNGNPTAKLMVTGRYTLSPDGLKYSGTSHFEVRDNDGNLLAADDVENEGTRQLFVAPSPTPP
jgi:hypothetical protein